MLTSYFAWVTTLTDNDIWGAGFLWIFGSFVFISLVLVGIGTMLDWEDVGFFFPLIVFGFIVGMAWPLIMYLLPLVLLAAIAGGIGLLIGWAVKNTREQKRLREDLRKRNGGAYWTNGK